MNLKVWKLGTVVAALGLSLIAHAQLDFYDTNVVFTGNNERPLSGYGSGAYISPDGKFVGFMSSRHGLRYGDLPLTNDVFVRSLTGGQIYGISKFAGKYFPVRINEQPQGLPVMPSNGGVVTFFLAEYPVVGLSPDPYQIYAHNRETGETNWASVPPAGTAIFGFCNPIAIDNPGTRLIFTGSGPQGRYGIYVRDFTAGTTVRVHETERHEVPVLGASANGLNILYRDNSGLSLFQNGVKKSILPASAFVHIPHWVSDDGKTAILESNAALDPLDTGGNDLYVLNLETKIGVRLPRPDTEVSLRAIHVTRNGRFIAAAPYGSSFAKVLDRTTNKWTDFTPYNIGQEHATSIAVDDSGNNLVVTTHQANLIWLTRSSRVLRYLDDIGQPNLPDDLDRFAVTPDERFVFVQSRDIFRDGVFRSVRRDLTTGADVVVPNTPVPVAVSNNGRYVLGRDGSLGAQHVDLKRGAITQIRGTPVGMDGPGNLVVFQANNQVWVRNISRGEEYLLSYTTAGLGGNGPSGSAVISNNGHYVYFTSSARDLAAGRQLSEFPEDYVDKSLFRWNSQTRRTELVLVPVEAGRGFYGIDGPQVSADGRYVAYSFIVSSADTLFFPTILDTQSNRWKQEFGGRDTRIVSISPDGQHALVGDEYYNPLKIFRFGDGKIFELLNDLTDWPLTAGQMTNNRRVWLARYGAIIRGRYEFR